MAITRIRNAQVNVVTDFDIQSNKLTNVTDPTGLQDAATKGYVDALVNGLDWKASVKVASTANLTLSGEQTIDGIVTSASRILVKNQTTATANGIYVTAAGAWSRSTDADTSAEVNPNIAVMVEQGTTLADTQWLLSTDAPITLDTTNLTFIQIGAGSTYTAADASIVISGTTIKVATGTAGQTFIGNASGVATPTTLTGDVSSISGTGVVTLAATVIKQAGIVTRETPSGAVNGSNVAFTLLNTPITGTERLFLNGLLQDLGGGNDYTISGVTITFVTAPATGDRVRVNYFK